MPMTKEERADYMKKWRLQNKEKIAASSKKYRDKNRDKVNATTKKWREKNKEEIAAYNKTYREEHKEERAAKSEDAKAYAKKYYENNKDTMNAKNKEWAQQNKDKLAAYNKEYRLTPSGQKSEKISRWKQQGMIADDWDEVYNKFINTTCCEFCGNQFKNSQDKQLDHDHETGEVRGVLCCSCNRKDVFSDGNCFYRFFKDVYAT